jgi:hypothetical protein
MARKQKIAPSFAPITTEIANAIKAASDGYKFENFELECEEAAVDMGDYDHIYLNAEGCQIRIAVGTGEIPIPGKPVPTQSYGRVIASGWIVERLPGLLSREKLELEGTLELDYSKPEAKINGDRYLDMLLKAVQIKRSVCAVLKTEIV